MSMEGVQSVDFLVKRDDWRQFRSVVSSPPAELQPGQVLFRVDRFAFTSNNISYAQVGDLLDYWGFFPAEEGWGRLPTMGFADVVASKHPDVAEGERVFGFFPMSTHLAIQADEVGATSFVDGVAHRRNHAPAYRQYLRTSADPLYEAGSEDRLMLLRGLFMTSFLVDDFLADNDFFGAEASVIASASSKTAIALSFLLSRRGRGRVIGLTSPRNVDFVESLGSYDQTLPYADLKSLSADVPTVFVDHSGDGDVVNALHHHFGDRLRYSCMVGATHWGASPRSPELPGATPSFFFAPEQMVKRSREWGPAGFQQRLGDGLRRFVASSRDWMQVVRGHGAAEVEGVYREILEGRAQPSQGHVLSLWDEV
jgi:hypothetical protein